MHGHILRAGALGRSARLARPTIGAAIIAAAACAYGAAPESDDPRSGTAGLVEPAAPRPQVRVQPRASEFAPPYNQPDLSPESVRAVEQLYDELTRGTAARCSRVTAPTRGRRSC